MVSVLLSEPQSILINEMYPPSNVTVLCIIPIGLCLVAYYLIELLAMFKNSILILSQSHVCKNRVCEKPPEGSEKSFDCSDNNYSYC